MRILRRAFPLLRVDSPATGETTNLATLRRSLATATAERDEARREAVRLSQELEEARSAIRVHEVESRALWLVIERDRSRIGAELAQHERTKAVARADTAVADLTSAD